MNDVIVKLRALAGQLNRHANNKLFSHTARGAYEESSASILRILDEATREQSEHAGPSEAAVRKAHAAHTDAYGRESQMVAAIRAALKIDGPRLIAAEREACAQIAERTQVADDQLDVAATIRERG